MKNHAVISSKQQFFVNYHNKPTIKPNEKCLSYQNYLTKKITQQNSHNKLHKQIEHDKNNPELGKLANRHFSTLLVVYRGVDIYCCRC